MAAPARSMFGSGVRAAKATRAVLADGVALSVVPGSQLSDAGRDEVVALCSEAYEVDFSEYLAWLRGVTHVFARERGGRLVSHACWVTRWLQPGTGPLLRTAYVEAVATAADARNRGLASAVMRQIARAIRDYDIGALSPTTVPIYKRLGWRRWRGPLFVRTDAGIEPSPDDEGCMILRLPKTPPLDVTQPLSVEWRLGEIW